MIAAQSREDAMLRVNCGRFGRLLAASALVALGAGMAAAAVGTAPADCTTGADGQGVARAAWLLQRDSIETLALTGLSAQPDEFGGGGAAEPAVVNPAATDVEGKKLGGALPVLASLVLPGAGEAMLGHKRGYAMMALDIFAWTQVAKYNSEGDDLTDEYYAFADAHYTDERLAAAYVAGGSDIDDFYRADIGTDYFPDFPPISTVDDLDNLPLYVTKEEDRREYYENLGKWDQFVFGWDDFIRPDDTALTPPGYTPSGDAKTDLEQPWVSANRESYRVMRDEANDAYESRDHWLYVNIGLRVFSVVQTAWLNGLLGGSDVAEGDTKLSVGGHDVRLIAQPTGLRRATVAAAVTF
jgi:hypothetical protein